MRQPLKSRHGCLNCKSRKKKCDETKPVCTPCSRLRLVCRWPVAGEGVEEVMRKMDEPSYGGPSNSTELDVGPELEYTERSADHASTRSLMPFEFDHIADPFQLGQIFPTSLTEFAAAFDEHVMIGGIFGGWERMQEQFGLDTQWEYIMHLDRETARCGQGYVARLASVWCFRIMMKYFAMQRAIDQFTIPQWYIPQETQLRYVHPAIIDFFVWPGFRERLIMCQNQYCTGKFIQDYMVHGFRFLWPYAAKDAIVWDERSCMLGLSPELKMRIQNLRSYTVSHHFLELYPEFRGMAPQLEPSATLHQPGTDQDNERIYWMLLRSRDQRRDQLPSVPKRRGRKKKRVLDAIERQPVERMVEEVDR